MVYSLSLKRINMDIKKLPDNEMKPLNIETILTMQKRRYALVIAALMVVNIIMFIMLTSEEGDITHKLSIGLKTIGIGSFVLGFGLGLITALIPYKNFQYSEKYFRASLLNIIIIQVLLIPAQFFFENI